MVVPEKDRGEKKRVVYGSKPKNQKEKATKGESNPSCRVGIFRLVNIVSGMKEIEQVQSSENEPDEAEAREEGCLESWEDLASWEDMDPGDPVSMKR